MPSMVMPFEIGVSAKPDGLWNVASNQEKRILRRASRRGSIAKFISQLRFQSSSSIVLCPAT